MHSTQATARLTVFAFLLCLAAPLAAQDRIPWITDLEQAQQLAERQHRLVLLHFWSETCGPCRRLETGVFNQPQFIRALTTGYIPVKINAADQPRLVTFYNIESVPTDVIVTPEGREIQRFTSKQDPNAYIAMLDGIRARAGVGAYAQASTGRGVPPAQQTAQVVYGANENFGRPNQRQLGSQPPVPQNSNANPLNQSPSAQPSNVAPRYANPYAREQPASSLGGSRWGNQQQSSSTGQAPRPNSQPQENQYTEHAVTAQNGYSVSPGQTQPPENQYTRNLVIQNSAQSGQPIQGYGERTGPSPREAAAPSRATSQRQAAPSQPTVALEGYCPVTLIDNRGWLVGNKRWGAVHEGHIYLFAGQEQQQKFLRNPHLYAPLNAGYDPVVYAETGQRVPGKREFGLYIEDPGPIALFADEASLQRFEQNAGYYYDALSQAAAQRRQQQR